MMDAKSMAEVTTVTIITRPINPNEKQHHPDHQNVMYGFIHFQTYVSKASSDGKKILS